MGGSVYDIVRLFAADVSRLVIVANVAAWPVAYVLMRRWLDGFAYRIDLSLLFFIAGTLVALGVAIATVAAVTARAAATSPIHALRYE